MLCARVVRGSNSNANARTPFSEAEYFPSIPEDVETQSRLITPQNRQIFRAGAIVRAVAQHLNDDIGGAENLGTLRNNFRAFGCVVGVGISRFRSAAVSTTTSIPAFVRLGITPGTSATLRSPG